LSGFFIIIAMAETIHSSKDYHFPKVVITLVFFTEKKTPKPDNNILVQDFLMRNLKGEVVENARGLKHQLIFVFTEDPLSDLEIPKPCQQWIEAINDTLDGQVDENEYENPLIKQLFQVISTDKTTPEEYAQMKEEYNQKRIVEEKLLRTLRNLKELGKLTEIEIAQAANLTLEEVQAL